MKGTAAKGSAAKGSKGPESPEAATFMRALMVGALVGAAIAGSTLWSRLHGAADAPEADADASNEADGTSSGAASADEERG
jgi:hypothetical protein